MRARAHAVQSQSRVYFSVVLTNKLTPSLSRTDHEMEQVGQEGTDRMDSRQSNLSQENTLL